MTTPFSETRAHPLTTDEHVLERVTDIVERAYRRQIWLMFVDDEARQIPLLMPTDVPRTPRKDDLRWLGEFLREVFDEAEAASIIVTFERPGSDRISDADRRWLRLLHEACQRSEIPMRGPLLAHNGGVRWVAAEDYLID